MNIKKSFIILVILGYSVISLTASDNKLNHAGNAVVPIDWSRFTAPYPNDANAELEKAIAQNALKFALNVWYEQHFGAEKVDEYYLDILLGDDVRHEKVRHAASQAVGIATMIKLGLYDAQYIGVSEQTALDYCIKITRSIAYLHRVNLGDGGWGGTPQSGWWTATAGLTAWLTWELYDEKSQEMIRKMVEWEANYLMNRTVPYYRKKDGTIVTPGDTKGEENAWDTTVLFFACAMMPNHENYHKWYNKGLEFAISSYAHPNDMESDSIINGKPLKEWLNGSNTEENFTVVNHNRIYPEYSAGSRLLLWNAAALTLAGKPTPEAVFFNCDKVYRAVVEVEFASPPYLAPGGTSYKPGDGDIYYPQGGSWGSARHFIMGPWDALHHAYGLDTELTHDGAYWETLHSGRAKELQDRFDDGHMFADATENRSGLVTESLVTYEVTTAILAKWAVLQKDFRITKEAPKSINNK